MDPSRIYLSIQKGAERLSRADIIFYLMPALMALLVIGTWAQREMGLYAAHQMYFASFVFWAGFMPLPGGYTLLIILSANLLLKFLFFSEWSWRKAGIILSHLGAIILLLGGLLTALSAKEGFMVIAEGQKSPFVYDYHKRELLIFKNDTLAYVIPREKLLRATSLPLNIQIENACENCRILKRAEHEQDFAQDKTPHSLAQFMALEPDVLRKEAEANISGFSFSIENLDDDLDGIYIVFEGMPRPIEFTYQGDNYKIIYGKQQRRLPFEIALEDFDKDTYPGMPMARGYSSEVIVLDEGVRWNARIEMNAPLRYKGYTFYQSSFDDSDDTQITVLSVVENKGRIFPYLGTFILALGLLVHLLIIYAKRGKA
ncbi:MAG: cytochrome c biogenesis protein ResB [Alphaproteobacteria bacterium]